MMRGFALTLAVTCCLAGSAQAAPIFSNDFSTDTHGFTTATNVGIVTAPSSQKFLQLPDQGSTTTLTLNTTGYVGGTVSLAFSLYVVGSMDGTGPTIQGGGGGDFFTVTSGGSTLFNQAFANYDGRNLQTYPTPGSPPTTGAASINTLGYTGFPDSGNHVQDSIYNFTLTFTPTAASTAVTFTTFANEGVGNEFYGIDNVVANATAAIPAVPEPGTWVLMLGGFGLIGASMRRRRATAMVRPLLIG